MRPGIQGQKQILLKHLLKAGLRTSEPAHNLPGVWQAIQSIKTWAEVLFSALRRNWPQKTRRRNSSQPGTQKRQREKGGLSSVLSNCQPAHVRPVRTSGIYPGVESVLRRHSQERLADAEPASGVLNGTDLQHQTQPAGTGGRGKSGGVAGMGGRLPSPASVPQTRLVVD